MAIVAAKEIYSNADYVHAANNYLELLIQNIENNEWSLRYFSAQIYLDLYSQTDEATYLGKAYRLILDNVNYLIGEQKTMNTTYLNDVKEVALPDDPSKDMSKDEKESIKDEQKRIKEYNKALKEKRKVELPPVYEPLVLNCDLLFALADEPNLMEYDKNRIEGILHENGNDLFLTKPLDNEYSFSPEMYEVAAQFDKDTLTLPASCVSETSFIKVTVNDNGKESVYEDWTVKEVEREADDIASFKASFTSKECKDQTWSSVATVKVELFNEKDSNTSPVVLQFKVSKFKEIPVLPDIVEFEQV